MTDEKRTAKGMWWDRAWTLTKGCTPVTEGCRSCWSAAQSHIRSKQAKPPQCYVGVTDDAGKWTGHAEALPAMLDRPLRVRKPQTWAVWNDLFHEDVPDRFIAAVFGVMAACPQHTFLVLTKRPERMRAWFGWFSDQEGVHFKGVGTAISFAVQAVRENGGTVLEFNGASLAGEFPLPNVWLGTSASTQADLERVVPDLLATPAAVRFISYEPALEGIVFDADWLMRRCSGCNCHEPCPHGCSMALTDSPRISWVICGAESGPKRRPMEMSWARNIVEQCKAAGVSCFVKQMDIDGRVSKDMSEWPEWARIRELPVIG